ncbi:peptidylprolyl isomerase [Clostridium sp.]|uniref:peptidylprolyl isomerase n=1 Tax=Clostridium sp. TaxID=1506 RepID=UPI003464BC00
MNKKVLTIFTVIILAFCLISCDKGKKTEDKGDKADNNNHYVSYENIELDQLKRPEIGETIAIIKTNYGEIRLRLFEDIAPKAVENFKTLAKEGFYSGHAFTKMGVVSAGIGKIGEPDYEGKSIYEGGFDIEIDDDYAMLYGSVVIPRRIKADGKNFSNFCIIDKDFLMDEEKRDLSSYGFPEKITEAFEKIGGNVVNKDEITVFGQVFYGMDTIEKMREVKLGSMGEPLDIIEIESIELSEYEGDI